MASMNTPLRALTLSMLLGGCASVAPPCSGAECTDGGSIGGTVDGGVDGGVDAGPAQGDCAGTLIACGVRCVDHLSSVDECGACGASCTGPGQVCNRGRCATLPDDCTADGGGCAPGYGCEPTSKRCMVGCRLQNDCPAGGGCFQGRCVCSTGQHACGQQCVADDSVASCGNACTRCPPAPSHGTARCVQGQCEVQCDADHFRCGEGCCKTVLTATIDGVARDFSAHPKGLFFPMAMAMGVTSDFDAGLTFPPSPALSLSMRGNGPGTFRCDAGTGALGLGSDRFGFGGCEVVLEVADAGRLAGRFSAVVSLVDGGSQSTVTDGRFDVPY